MELAWEREHHKQESAHSPVANPSYHSGVRLTDMGEDGRRVLSNTCSLISRADHSVKRPLPCTFGQVAYSPGKEE